MNNPETTPDGCALDQPEVCRNGWTVQQVHIFGTGPCIQEFLVGPAESVRRGRKTKARRRGEGGESPAGSA